MTTTTAPEPRVAIDHRTVDACGLVRVDATVYADPALFDAPTSSWARIALQALIAEVIDASPATFRATIGGANPNPPQQEAAMPGEDRHGTCQTCDGPIYRYPHPNPEVPDRWVHRRKADWEANPHNPIPKEVDA